MKKNMRTFKKTIKMFSILFLTILSSLFFVKNVNALTNEDGYNYIYLKYNRNFINKLVNNDSFKSAINDIYQTKEGGGYFNHIIYMSNNKLYGVLTYDYLDFRLIKNNNILNFDLLMNNHYKMMVYKYENEIFIRDYNDSNNKIVSGSNLIFTINSSNNDFNNNYSEYDSTFFIYDSNIPNVIYLWDSNYFTFYNLNNNTLISHGDSMPLAKDNLISIDYSTTNNTKVVNDKEYILSKDLTINYNVDDYTKYIYLYKKESDDNWSTYNFTTDNTSFTLNITENTSYIARIVDKSTNEDVYTSSFTITGINYDEYIQDILNISYSTKDNVLNDKIISKDLTIKYTTYDYTKYIFQYKNVNDDNFTTYNFISSNTSLTLNVTENDTYVARILDKSTLEQLYVSSFTITGISNYDTLTLVKTFNSGTNGNDLYSLNITNTSSYDIRFKIQFGSNDFSTTYVPRIIGIKGYTYNPITQERKENDFVNVKDFKCYRELEGDTEVWCTGILSKPQNISAYYQILFENTDNYYLYYYDNSTYDHRILDITTNLFKDYNKYRFNSNSDKAYIYLKNKDQTNIQGSVIIPYYYLNNDDLSVKLLKYNRDNNTFSEEYSSYFIGDNYYKEIPFTIENSIVPVLTNKKGQHCEVYYYGEGTANLDEGGYYTWVGDTKTFIPFSWNNNNLYNIYEGLTCYQEEPVYFYVHKDFKVSFNTIDENKESTSNVVISDENGNIFFDIDKDSDNTDVYKEENTSFFEMVKGSFNYFTSPLSEFLNMFAYFWNGLNIIIKYFIVFIFVFILALFIFKFIL